MAGRQLTSQNATITTVEVKLDTLTVKGKQVTLAVFRQLPEESLIAEDGTLNGVPWGHINYHPDKCADNAPHWHVVWQRGEELLRSAVQKNVNLDGRRIKHWDGYECDGCFNPIEADAFVDFQFHEWATSRGTTNPLIGAQNLASERYEDCVHWVANGVTVHAEPAYSAIEYWKLRKSTDLDALREHAERPLNLNYMWPLARLGIQDLEPLLSAAHAGGVGIWHELGGGVRITTPPAADAVARALRVREADVLTFLVDQRGDAHKDHERARTQLNAALEDLNDDVEASGQTLEDAEREFHKVLGEEVARRQRHRDARQAIGDLTQLYIAV